MIGPPEPIIVDGIPVHPLTKSQLVDYIANGIQGTRLRRVYNVNAHAMNLANSQRAFRLALQRADVVYCDGSGVQLGARLLGEVIPERLTVMSWLDDALTALAENGRSVFLIGDRSEVIERAALDMGARHANLRVVGVHNGYFDPLGEDGQRLVEELRDSKPDVVLVGMGMPRQELWIESIIALVPSVTFIPVGAAFVWYTGTRRRAPRWVGDIGFEWLGRLVQEPRRLWRRYLIGNPAFILRVIRQVNSNR